MLVRFDLCRCLRFVFLVVDDVAELLRIRMSSVGISGWESIVDYLEWLDFTFFAVEICGMSIRSWFEVYGFVIPQKVATTREIYAQPKDHSRDCRVNGRPLPQEPGDWVHCGTGAVQGELKKKSVPRWPATKVKARNGAGSDPTWRIL